ncbi:MAG: class I SAM-dependent methyltransferase [Flavobacterium sp.]
MMKNQPSIIDFYGSINTAHLHPKRDAATALLLQKIEIQPNDHVLELGFGTAATLVWAASQFRQSHFYGIEHNALMFRKGQNRIKLCRLKNCRLFYNEKQSELAFPDKHFDRIYAESVLAIQEGEVLETLFQELCRVLKPKGKLVINEGIWTDTFSSEQIAEMNAFCQTKFGIIQANGNYPYAADWKLLFEKSGFVVNQIDDLETAENFPSRYKPLFENTISKAFSLYGKVLLQINRKYRKQFACYKKEMAVTASKGNYLKGFLFDCTKA